MKINDAMREALQTYKQGFITLFGRTVKLKADSAELSQSAKTTAQAENLFREIRDLLNADKNATFHFVPIAEEEKPKKLKFDNGKRKGFLMLNDLVVTEMDVDGNVLQEVTAEDHHEASELFDIKAHGIFATAREKAVYDAKTGLVKMPKRITQEFVECPQPQRIYFEITENTKEN